LTKGQQRCAITKKGLQVLLETVLQPTTFTCAEAYELAAALKTGCAPASLVQQFSSEHGSALDCALPKLADELWTGAIAIDCAEGRVRPYENRLELVSGDVFSFSVVVRPAKRIAYAVEIRTSPPAP
jgi:hypothetical protein